MSFNKSLSSDTHRQYIVKLKNWSFVLISTLYLKED